MVMSLWLHFLAQPFCPSLGIGKGMGMGWEEKRRIEAEGKGIVRWPLQNDTLDSPCDGKSNRTDIQDVMTRPLHRNIDCIDLVLPKPLLSIF